MKSRSLFIWGLVCGGVALVALIAGLAFFWSDNGWDDVGCFGTSGREGMMGGGGMMGPGGMMGGNNMMGPGGMMGQGGMMGGYGSAGGGPTDLATSPLTLDQAADAAKRYVDNFGNSDLKVKKVIEFTNAFYVRVDEQSTGAGALELSVDRNSGATSLEAGPGAVWNTKYGGYSGAGGYPGIMGGSGMMGNGGVTGPGGMMGNGNGSGGMMDPGYGGRGSGTSNAEATTNMPVTKAQAKDRAQQFLDRQLPGTKAAEPDTFYGYYTVEVDRNGQPFGLLSINGFYGQAWYHSLEGAYLSGKNL